MHTDLTLGWLQECTANLGTQLRRFQSYTCTFFDTRELPSEEATRSRRPKKTASSDKPSRKKKLPAKDSQPDNETKTPKKPPKKVLFSLAMIKLHFLGDYVNAIKMFGASDSYSTQPVSFILDNEYWSMIVTFPSLG